ncbi:hypothetical protein BH24ACT21_BH24ACT21_12340 [soil metagenome]
MAVGTHDRRIVESHIVHREGHHRTPHPVVTPGFVGDLDLVAVGLRPRLFGRRQRILRLGLGFWNRLRRRFRLRCGLWFRFRFWCRFRGRLGLWFYGEVRALSTGDLALYGISRFGAFGLRGDGLCCSVLFRASQQEHSGHHERQQEGEGKRDHTDPQEHLSVYPRTSPQPPRSQDRP